MINLSQFVSDFFSVVVWREELPVSGPPLVHHPSDLKDRKNMGQNSMLIYETFLGNKCKQGVGGGEEFPTVGFPLSGQKCSVIFSMQSTGIY